MRPSKTYRMFCQSSPLFPCSGFVGAGSAGRAWLRRTPALKPPEEQKIGQLVPVGEVELKDSAKGMEAGQGRLFS